MKRKSYEKVYAAFKQAGLELIDKQYISVDHPMKCKDKNGYFYNRTLRTVKSTLKKGKQFTVQPFNTNNLYFYENILRFMNKECDTGTILLTPREEISSTDNTILSFQCGKCGKVYHKRWRDFKDNQYKVCNDCYKEIRPFEPYVEKRRNSLQLYYNKAIERNFKVLNIIGNNYKGKIELEDKDGYRGRMTISQFMRGSQFERHSVRNPYTLYNLRLYANRQGWNIEIIPQKFKGTDYPIKIRCECGEIFETNAYHFLEGVYRCRKCRAADSTISLEIKRWLDKNYIVYIQEYAFKDCRYKYPLPFDYYLPKYNACIEVDGIHHYKPVVYTTKEEAMKNYNLTQTRDNIKTGYCKNNNIPLLRIPFWEIEKSTNYIDILTEFISSLQINDL